MGTGTARRCEEFPSGTSSAGGREAAVARGGETRRADAGAGRWEMGRAATGAMPRRGNAAEAGIASGVAEGGAAATITGRAGWRNTGGGGARVSI